MQQSDKWQKQYIAEIDLKKIQWLSLTEEKYFDFLKENYFDEEQLQYVSNGEVPFGMHYIGFGSNTDDCQYLLGIVPNKINKKTIVAACMYYKSYYLFIDQSYPFTYISTIETNEFFRSRGLCRQLCEEISHILNDKTILLCSAESQDGKKHHVLQILKDSIKKEGLTIPILSDKDIEEKSYQKYIHK